MYHGTASWARLTERYRQTAVTTCCNYMYHGTASWARLTERYRQTAVTTCMVYCQIALYSFKWKWFVSVELLWLSNLQFIHDLYIHVLLLHVHTCIVYTLHTCTYIHLLHHLHIPCTITNREHDAIFLLVIHRHNQRLYQLQYLQIRQQKTVQIPKQSIIII